jgi:hypothetical protein
MVSASTGNSPLAIIIPSGARLLDNAIRRAPLFNFHFSIFNWTKASEQGTWPVVGGGNADIHIRTQCRMARN